MTLGENMQRLLKMYRENYTREERETLEKSIEENLVQCEDVDEIKGLISLDVDLILSEKIRQLAFEKLLKMGDRTWQVLAGYAAHLTMYYPPNSQERIPVEKLLEEANRLKQAEEQQAENTGKE